MAHPKVAEETKILSIRFPEALIKKLDRYVKKFQKQFPGISFQRTDAIRLLVERGLKEPVTQDHEIPEPPKPAKPPKAEKPKKKKETKVGRPAKRKPSAGKTKPRKKR